MGLFLDGFVISVKENRSYLGEKQDFKNRSVRVIKHALLVLSIMVLLCMISTRKYAKFVLSFFVVGFSLFLVFSLFSGLKKKAFQDFGLDDAQEAEVRIQKLSFVQTETGLMSWSLDASEADLTEKGKKALLKNVSVTIPYGDQQQLFLKGDEGAVDTEKKAFSLWKKTGLMAVELENGYTLHTRGLQWHEPGREIVSQGAARITGAQIEIDGNSLRVSVDRQEMTIIGDVKASVH